MYQHPHQGQLVAYASQEREIEIVRNLAFLSAISNNTQEVMAVCVEELPDGKGATIRLASNMGDLVVVTRGFEILAKILEEAARRGGHKFISLHPRFGLTPLQ